MAALLDRADKLAKQLDTARAERSGLVVVSAAELIAHKFPEREPLLGDWLLKQSLCMVHAWRGTGKTYFGLAVAYAVASGGSFLKWNAGAPHRVLYMDGEMPGIAMQGRVSDLALSNDKEPPADYFQLMTRDLQTHAMPDLATIEGQIAVAAFIKDADLVVVDNLSTLARRGGKENEGESWLPIADWALEQRAAGKAVLFVHHSGKGGQQRGTSRREDILDVVISLHHPADYQATEGARFVISFEKARGLTGEAVVDFEAALTTDAEHRQTWITQKCADVELERVAQLVKDGATQSDVAEELDLSRFQAGRRIKAAIERGLISKSDLHDGRKGGVGP